MDEHDDSPHTPAPAVDCAAVVKEIYVFLDGELTEAKRGAISAHLDGCSPCLEAFDFEAELRMVVSSRCVDPVPPELLARIERLLFDPPPEPGPAGSE